jgi:hypothetical protein
VARFRPRGSVIPGIGPELPGLGSAPSGIEHWRRRLIGEQLGGCPQMIEQAFVQGAQEPSSPADPVGQGGAVELDALPGVDLRLAVERQMIGILPDDDMRDQPFGRQAALDQPLG